MRILLAEDNKEEADIISGSLTDSGYDVIVYEDGQLAAREAREKSFDILIMECVLPRTNGFDITRSLRSSNIMTPIILMTTGKSDRDVVTGLDSGADYCIGMPTVEEIAASVRAISRRFSSPITADKIMFGDLTLSLTNYTLRNDGHSVRLGHKEFEFMRIFMTQRSNVITKEKLFQDVWGSDSSAELNSVEVYISFLRSKLRKLESNVKIMTIRECGYYIEAAA